MDTGQIIFVAFVLVVLLVARFKQKPKTIIDEEGLMSDRVEAAKRKARGGS